MTDHGEDSTTRRRDAAPNEEWVLMYRGGLTTRRIAELVGVPHSTVHYHLRVARAPDPDLEPVRRGAAASRRRG